jgi:predicted small lipoprotein YifL
MLDLPLNSKLLFILTLLFLASCGVKGDPSPPRGSAMPSFLENYPDIKMDKAGDDSLGKKKK